MYSIIGSLLLLLSRINAHDGDVIDDDGMTRDIYSTILLLDVHSHHRIGEDLSVFSLLERWIVTCQIDNRHDDEYNNKKIVQACARLSK